MIDSHSIAKFMFVGAVVQLYAAAVIESVICVPAGNTAFANTGVNGPLTCAELANVCVKLVVPLLT